MSGFDCELPIFDTSRFGDGDDALGRCVAELPSVRRLVGVDDVWSYANTGFWLAAWLAAERAGTTFEDALAREVLRPGRPRGHVVRRARARRDRVRGACQAPIRALGAPRADWPRRSTTSCGSAAGISPNRNPPVCASRRARRSAASTGSASPARSSAASRSGATAGRTAGSSRRFSSCRSANAVFAGLTNGSKGAKALKQIEDEFFRLVVGDTRHDPPYRKLSPDDYEAFVGVYENSGGRYAVSFPEGSDGLVVESEGEELIVLAIDERTFQVPIGEFVGERCDFPGPGLARFGGRLAERVS